jgi:hypothetical protein
MTVHSRYVFSVTMHTDDLAIVNCLRALSQFSQKSGNNRIPWGGTKDADWERDGHEVTFRFSQAPYRDAFVGEARRLLPPHLWTECRRSNNDPAKPQ